MSPTQYHQRFDGQCRNPDCEHEIELEIKRPQPDATQNVVRVRCGECGETNWLRPSGEDGPWGSRKPWFVVDEPTVRFRGGGECVG